MNVQEAAVTQPVTSGHTVGPWAAEMTMRLAVLAMRFGDSMMRAIVLEMRNRLARTLKDAEATPELRAMLERLNGEIERYERRRRQPKATGRTDEPDRGAPTLETAARLQRDPLARLVKAGKLTPRQYEAAMQFRDVVEWANSGVLHAAPFIRGSSSGGYVPRSDLSDAAYVQLGAERRIEHWRLQVLRAGLPLGAIWSVLVDYRPLRETERANRLRNGSLLDAITTALGLFGTR